jgi:hypothetical protein
VRIRGRPRFFNLPIESRQLIAQLNQMRKAFLIGYAKLSNCTHDAVIRVFEGIPLARQSLALAPNHPTTEYKFDHSVHLVYSVEKSLRKELFIGESGPRRG